MIIVGGGHNGLVAACYLARAGVDVLVVEAYEKLGGMTSTSPMVPEAPEHMINDGSIQASLWNSTTIDADLELSSKYGLRPVFTDPFHVHLAPGGESLAFWRDYRKTAEEIRYFSPKDAEIWLKYCHTIDKAVAIGLPFMRTSAVKPRVQVSDAGARRRLQGLRPARQYRALDGPLVRRGGGDLRARPDPRRLHPAGAVPELPSQDLGGCRAPTYFGLIHRHGACLFEGGTGSLPLALMRCLEAAGGRVRANAPVEALTVSGGRVTGMRAGCATARSWWRARR